MKNVTISAKLLALLVAIIVICFVLLTSCTGVQQKPQIEPETETSQKYSSEITETEKTSEGENGQSKSQDEDPDITAEDKDGTETPESKEQVSLDLDLLSQLEEKFILEDAFSDISFERPVDLQNANDGSGQLFVVEQGILRETARI